jgi:hypothetical protein
VGARFAGKTGHRGDHRLWRGVRRCFSCCGRNETWPQSLGQRLRALRDAIEIGLLRGPNSMTIWQDLLDLCGFTAG